MVSIEKIGNFWHLENFRIIIWSSQTALIKKIGHFESFCVLISTVSIENFENFDTSEIFQIIILMASISKDSNP